MPNAGLSALAETYGLKAAELHQLKLLSERLFDELRESLAGITGKPTKMAQLKQEVQSSADFCAQPKPHHFMVFGIDDQAAMVFRMEVSLASALVRAALGSDLAGLAATEGAAPLALTALEARVLAHTVPDIFIAAVERVLGHVFAGRQDLRLLCSSERHTAVAERCEGSEQVVAASVECSIAGISATLAFAMPLAFVMQVRARLVPSRLQRRSDTGELERVQRALAGASLELSAVLGSVAMSLGEIRSLGQGSVVLVQKLRNDVPHVMLRCGERALFSGTIVEDGGWYRFLVQSRGE